MEEAIKLLGDPEKRREMSQNSIRKVRDNYTLEPIMNALKKCYEGKR